MAACLSLRSNYVQLSKQVKNNGGKADGDHLQGNPTPEEGQFEGCVKLRWLLRATIFQVFLFGMDIGMEVVNGC